MTVIRPNSISGVTSITAQSQSIEFYKSDGNLSGANLDGVNINTAGILTAANFKNASTNVHSIGIDVGSNVKIGTGGIITATSYRGDGSQLTGITGTTINNNADNRLITGSGTANTLNGESNLTFDGSTFTVNGDVTFTGANKNIIFDKSDDALEFNDNAKIVMGDSGELELFHSPNGHSYFQSTAGSLYIRTSGSNEIALQPAGSSENSIRAIGNGAVELYHDNAKTAYTHGSGFNIKGGNTSDQTELQIFGNEGQDASILLTSDDGDDNADNWRMYAQASDHSFALKNYAAGSYETSFRAVGNGAVELYHNNTKKFETTGGGSKVSGDLDVVGHAFPNANNTYDLGTSGNRWRNIYINDLNLSNEGSTNIVDNTWGDWTLQEGENDVFMINNRSGKKFKIKMEEVV